MSRSHAVQRLSHVLFIGVWCLFGIAHAQDGGSDSGGGDQSAPNDGGNTKVAHAVLGSIAWVVIFPAGSIVLRFAGGPKAWLVHSAIQAVGIALVTAGAGNGIYLAKVTDQLNEYHPIIGLVLFGTVWLQGIGGFIGHAFWKKRQTKTLVAHTHVWLGRALITLGIINGGLGLLLSEDAGTGAYIAYGVVGGVSWLLLVSNAVFHENKLSRRATAALEGDQELSPVRSSTGGDSDMHLRGQVAISDSVAGNAAKRSIGDGC